MRKSILLLLAAAAAAFAQYDQYGGWTKLKGRKTGFFYVERIGGKWWLVSPEGNAFFSKGVCHVAHTRESDSSPEPPDAAAWAKQTARQLRQWNFNTVGAWSVQEMWGTGLAYTPILGLAAAGYRDLWLKGGIPDYFSAEFREAAARAAERQCRTRAGDPRLLGYFTDNELRWDADWRSKESLFDTYMKLPENAPGRRKAVEFLKSRGRAPESATEEDKAAFLELAAAEYARVCRDAIRKYDTNHMIIGCRFAGYAPEPVLRGVGPYFDVISYNSYNPKAPVEMLARITELTGKPTMITEFSFKAMDSGLPNTKGAAKPVATQQDRADGFAAYVEALAESPSCVGFHWFQYRDQPKEGRRLDGENSNYGVVRIDFTPWETLTKRMTEVNATLEQKRAR